MKITKIIFINIFAIFIILFALEFISRTLGLSNLMGTDFKLVRYEKNNMHYLVPNSQGLVFNSKTFIDKYGYRIPNPDYVYKKKRKIFIIGDSVAFGNGVKEENTFSGLMRLNLNDYEIYNSSVFGYQISHFKKRINEINEFDPISKIIYVFTLNDVLGSSNVTTPNTKKISESNYDFIDRIKKIINIDFVYQINSFLRSKSYFYMYLKGVILDPQENWFKNVNNFYKNNEIKNLEEFVVLLKNKAKILNAELHIIVLPYEFQTRNCKEDDLVPQKKIRNLMEKSNTKFYDFTDDFCKSKNPKKLFYKYDPMHLSLIGHKFVYDKINNIINF